MRDRWSKPRGHQAALRVTDFDRAVLAAAKIGALTQRTVASRFGGKVVVKSWFMGHIRVDASIRRLCNAGELMQKLDSTDITLYFPGDGMFDTIVALREALRRRATKGN